jgi:hypothetical protein
MTKEEFVAKFEQDFGNDFDAIFTKFYDEETKEWRYPVDELPVLSRKDAVALGMKKFFTGEPCLHGHVEPRKVKGGCMGCIRERIAARKKAKKQEA